MDSQRSEMAEPWPSYSSSSSRGKKKRPCSPNDDATSSKAEPRAAQALVKTKSSGSPRMTNSMPHQIDDYELAHVRNWPAAISQERLHFSFTEIAENKMFYFGSPSATDALSQDNLIFSDTLIALQLMRTQFPKLEKVVTQPFILQSQLYSSVKDRTQVDRDLESLKKDRVLRVFKLNTGQDDHAIMFMDDYLKQMQSAVRRSTGKNKDDSEVFEWFEKYVLHSKLDVSIDHLELCSLLSHGGDATDKHITLLMNAGLLTRQLIDPNMYWFSIPSIGPILKGLSQGRKEVLSLLNRRKYKEMLLSSLEKTRLRLSPLDVRFHLRDLIGSGHIKTVQTPTGLLVRVSTD